MIKVNLLRSIGMDPTSAAAGGPKIEAIPPEVKKQAAIKFAIILVLPILLYLYEQVQISELEGALARIQSQIQEVDAQKAKFGDAGPRMEKFAEEKKKIDKQLDAVRAITKGRLREVKSLDALQSLVPPKTWFKKVAIVGNVIKLTGYTTSEEGVGELVTALQNSALFSQIETKTTVQESLPNGPSKRFEVEFQFGRAGE